MFNKFKMIDNFSLNILIVFAGTSLTNFLNLLFQLLVAHKLPASEFAAFNSILSIYILISAPILTFQLAIVKYSAQFNAHHHTEKIRFLLSDLFKKALVMGSITLLIFWFTSAYLIKILKINSAPSGYILALLLAFVWPSTVFSGAIQGLELFKWLVSVSVLSGALKIIFALILISLGYNIAGALGALLISSVIGLGIIYFPLRGFIKFRLPKEDIYYKEIFTYLFPVALSNLCFMALITLDMILVKYFFTPQDSGFYSLAQMIGKIFLFLPAGVSIVMFPRTSGLNAKKMETVSTLKRSLLYVLGLCILALIIYNLFPSFILRVLTGKVFAESIFLGRLFGVSMTFFALLFILISYLLSIKDLRFIKYLVALTLLQVLGIVFFHRTLVTVQLVLCINSVLLFLIHLNFTLKKERE